jgi:hypothetical protein
MKGELPCKTKSHPFVFRDSGENRMHQPEKSALEEHIGVHVRKDRH